MVLEEGVLVVVGVLGKEDVGEAVIRIVGEDVADGMDLM
jgi:hypothetical protein